ncbi:MAG: dihydrodipicolinate synthase family protein [Candidatus Atribacteria bacterium]|nr:dihydrodipicolinate synthase family protein [Candidatus Atribacteria bacterium]
MKLLEGVIVAHTTPFNNHDQVNHDEIKKYIQFLIKKGVNGLFVCGTTAEAQILSFDERKKILETVLSENKGKMTIVAQCGTINLDGTRDLIKHSQSCGADGAGIVTPYYYLYKQEELFEYYSILAREFQEFPLYLYNIPALTGNNLEPSTVSRLSYEFSNIIGIKDSSGNLTNVSNYLLETRPGFKIFVGYDRAFLSVLLMGAHGTVTGPGGIFPEPFVEVWQAFQNKEYQKAMELQNKLNLISITIGEGNSLAMLKAALKLRGIGNGLMRRPFRSMSEEEMHIFKEKLEKVLQKTGYQL